ncbi:MAG: DinB family protein [Planctomycetota bacterium]|nr:MAG: DinB family protein [Planctomycetota bacterium]REK19985.1 MAG: DinB family protein [Planctomycetota bacterium]REK27552.1 MAG: DinB family protein [Planctomycetota bacterium]
MKQPDPGHIDNILQQLDFGPKLVVPLVREVPAAILKRRPAPGVWSAHEHACHLPAVQPLMMTRLEYILSDPAPVIEPYEPANDDPDDALLKVDLDEAMERFSRERRAMLDHLRKLTPEEWSITAEHGEYSHYSVFIMFRHIALHDLYHAYRIEQRLLNKDWADAR